ncbi:hypothetical protein U1Q18_024486 [Sarracenia purpurea var. burkii]
MKGTYFVNPIPLVLNCQERSKGRRRYVGSTARNHWHLAIAGDHVLQLRPLPERHFRRNRSDPRHQHGERPWRSVQNRQGSGSPTVRRKPPPLTSIVGSFSRYGNIERIIKIRMGSAFSGELQRDAVEACVQGGDFGFCLESVFPKTSIVNDLRGHSLCASRRVRFDSIVNYRFSDLACRVGTRLGLSDLGCLVGTRLGPSDLACLVGTRLGLSDLVCLVGTKLGPPRSAKPNGEDRDSLRVRFQLEIPQRRSDGAHGFAEQDDRQVFVGLIIKVTGPDIQANVPAAE